MPTKGRIAGWEAFGAPHAACAACGRAKGSKGKRRAESKMNMPSVCQNDKITCCCMAVKQFGHAASVYGPNNLCAADDNRAGIIAQGSGVNVTRSIRRHCQKHSQSLFVVGSALQGRTIVAGSACCVICRRVLPGWHRHVWWASTLCAAWPPDRARGLLRGQRPPLPWGQTGCPCRVQFRGRLHQTFLQPGRGVTATWQKGCLPRQ